MRETCVQLFRMPHPSRIRLYAQVRKVMRAQAQALMEPCAARRVGAAAWKSGELRLVRPN
jgi:hypothetical protein